MASKFLPSGLALSLLVLGFGFNSASRADDMMPPPPPGDALPPPPGADMTVPPPPGGDMMLPPPPGDTMAPPPPPAATTPAAAPAAPAGVLPPPPPPMAATPAPAAVAPAVAPPASAPLATPPPDQMFPEAPKAPAVAAEGQVTSYDVAKHDSLWKISTKTKIYGDPFQWPLLFIANRDLIKDPDLIEPGWALKVGRNNGTDVVSNAVQKAKETPRFAPHTAPRKKLPIDY